MLSIACYCCFNTKRNKTAHLWFIVPFPNTLNCWVHIVILTKKLKAYCLKMKMIFLSFAQCWPMTHQIVACLYSMYSQYGYLKCKALVFLPVLALKVKIIQLKLLHFTFKECIIYLLIKESYQNSKM